MGCPETYLAAHRDLLRAPTTLFDDPAWPMRTLATDRAGGRLREGADVQESLVAPGCDIAGTVRRCVLGPGVVVRAGAVVEDAVLFAGVTIEKDARVHTAILDENVVVRGGVRVGAEPASARAWDADIAVIGAGAVVRDAVGAGEQVEPAQRNR